MTNQFPTPLFNPLLHVLSNDTLFYPLAPPSLVDSRHKVLDIMDQCQSSPRQSLKDNGPVYGELNTTCIYHYLLSETMEVPLSKRHKLIGIGGHRIRALVEETGKKLRSSIC